MTTTIGTDHANELILVEDLLGPRDNPVVALGLINQDGSDTFPGRTLTPDQAEELAASLALCAAAARDRAGLAPTPATGEHAHAQALSAIKAAVALTGAASGGATGAEDSPPAVSEPASATTPSTSDIDAAAREGPEVAGEAQPRERGHVVQELPIAGYDGLSASVIAKRLSGLSAAQLSIVLAYEQSHRNRKTILARIAALQSADAPARDA